MAQVQQESPFIKELRHVYNQKSLEKDFSYILRVYGLYQAALKTGRISVPFSLVNQEVDEKAFNQKKGGKKIIKVIRKHDADELRFVDGVPALYRAILWGLEDLAIDLIEKNGVPDYWQQNGTTALHMAAHLRCPRVCEVLIRKGLQVTATDRNGLTPLELLYQPASLTHFGHKDSSVPLICDKDNLQVAKQAGHIYGLHTTARALFTDKNAYRAIAPQDRDGPIFAALKLIASFDNHYDKKHVAMFNYLMEMSRNFHMVDKLGNTLLDHAASQGAVSLMHYLLQHNADVISRGGDKTVMANLAKRTDASGKIRFRILQQAYVADLARLSASDLPQDIERMRTIEHELFKYGLDAATLPGLFSELQREIKEHQLPLQPQQLRQVQARLFEAIYDKEAAARHQHLNRAKKWAKFSFAIIPGIVALVHLALYRIQKSKRTVFAVDLKVDEFEQCLSESKKGFTNPNLSSLRRQLANRLPAVQREKNWQLENAVVFKQSWNVGAQDDVSRFFGGKTAKKIAGDVRMYMVGQKEVNQFQTDHSDVAIKVL